MTDNALIKKNRNDTNPFDDMREIEVKLFDRREAKHNNYVMKALHLIPTMRFIKHVIETYGEKIESLNEQVETELAEKYTRLMKEQGDQLDEMSDYVAKEIEEIKASGQNHEEVATDTTSNLHQLLIKQRDLVRKCESTLKDVERGKMQLYAQHILLDSTSLVRETLEFLFDNQRVTDGVVEGLSIPKVIEIVNGVYDLNDIEYLTQVPIIQKVMKMLKSQ